MRVTDLEPSLPAHKDRLEEERDVCPKHPKYKAVRPPTTLMNCRCNEIWMNKRIKEMLNEQRY